MSGIQDIGLAEYENASISLPVINDDLKLLVGYGPEWEQLSEAEKRQKTWERFDAIACGSLGKWELIQQDEQRRLQKERKRQWSKTSSSRAEAGSRSSISLNAPTIASSDGSGSSDGNLPRLVKHRNDSKEFRRASSNDASSSHEDVRALQFAARSFVSRRESSTVGEAPVSATAPDFDNRPAILPPLPADLITPKASPSRALGRHRSPSNSTAPFAGDGRARAGSVASSSTLSRQPSHLSLRSPSVAASSSLAHLWTADGKGKGRQLGPAAASERRAVSHSLPIPSDQPTPEKAAPQMSATSVLSSLMAGQTKKEPAPNSTSSGGWFWNRRKASLNPSPAKAAPSSVAVSPAKKDDQGLAVPLPPGTAVARNQLNASPTKKSSTALSVTLATPVTATTVATVPLVQSRAAAGQAAVQPISIQSSRSAAAAFNIATNDPLTDPRSLEEHSIQQYFFEAARQAGMSTRNLKARIAAEKQKRAARLNPSNPGRSSVMLQDQSRRWINIFPRAGRINNQRSVKWKSLCTPACLPLYTDYMPSSADLNFKYSRESYSLPVTAGMSSFLLRPGKNVQETAGNLLRELVNQRIAQSFQIIMPAYEDRPFSAFSAAAVNSRLSENDPWLLPTSPYIREILYNTAQGVGKGIYLNFSNVIHRIRYDPSTASVSVTTWSERHDWSTDPFEYKFMLKPFGSDTYTFRDVKFSYPSLNTYDWKYMDRLIAGFEDQALQEKTRYWRTRFILIPAEVPDLQAMLQSQSKVLLEDSTEDDLRIAGVMTLYEQFSKARWVPPGSSGKQSKSSL